MATVVIDQFPDEIKAKNKIIYQEWIILQEAIFWYDDIIWKKTNDLLKKSNLEYKKWNFIDWKDLYMKIMAK